ESVSVGVDGDDARGVLGAGDGDRGASDGAASEDGDDLTAQAAGGAGVHRVAEGLHQRCQLGSQTGHHRPQVVLGNGDQVGEHAVDVDTEDARVGADVEVAAAAFGTVPADEVRLDGDTVADL